MGQIIKSVWNQFLFLCSTHNFFLVFVSVLVHEYTFSFVKVFVLVDDNNTGYEYPKFSGKLRDDQLTQLNQCSSAFCMFCVSCTFSIFLILAPCSLQLQFHWRTLRRRWLADPAFFLAPQLLGSQISPSIWMSKVNKTGQFGKKFSGLYV